MMLLLLAACDLLGHDCNLMYAPSTTSVSFEVATAATWSWDVTGETVGMSCAVTLPDATDGACEGGEVMGPDVQGTDGAWVIGSSVWEGGDETLQVQVWRDGELVLDETIEPDWAVDEPNGKGCGERYTFAESWAIE